MNRNRHFSEENAKKIRDYQMQIGHGIDMLSDEEVGEIKFLVGENKLTVTEFRKLLSQQRRKSRRKIGDAPYLNYTGGVVKGGLAKSDSTQDLFGFGKEELTSTDESCGNADANRVGLETLEIDPAYQRSDYVNKKLVRSIQASFNLLLCGVVTVGKRTDGSMWVVDGHHRVLGAKRAGIKSLPCVVFDSRGPEHEAEVFYELNTKRTGVNCMSMYKAMLTQGEESTVHTQQLLEKFGFAIGKKTGEFSAANTIRESYKRGVLDRVLHVIKESFGSGSERWKWMFGSSHFVQMLTVIYAKAGDSVDDARMSLVLARMPHEEYQRLARTHAGTTGSRAAKIAPEFIRAIYNHQLKKDRLDWESM